jgi:signal transduction histidine kinase
MAETLKVLIVDDEIGMRLGAERALRDFRTRVTDVGEDVSFELDSASSAEEALEKIKACPPQLLLLDYKLPGMSGLELLDRVAGMDGETLTIMITAYASLETAVTATKRGAYDFLAKPFTPQELKEVVSKAAAMIVLSRQARRLAEEKRRVRFQFISVLAHELKAPLAAIEGYLHIVRDRSAGTGQETYDHMVDRSLVRLEAMRKMIMDLLDLTHIESGQRGRNLERLDLVELARAALETFAPAAADRRLAVSLNANGRVEMTADRSEAEIILNNLVSNAVKYNTDGGKVDVTLAADGPNVRIDVADTGIGLTDDEAARLFKDFVRIKNPRTRNILGSGLGLSLVRKLAQLYGGDASVKSRPGEGSTFSVVLKRDLSAEDASQEP